MGTGNRITLLSALMLAACVPAVDRPGPSGGYPPAGGQRNEPLPYPSQPDDAAPRADDVAQLPAPRPAWEARPVAPDAQTVREQTYLVQPGDSLRRVAERTGAGSEAIARANGLSPPFAIRAGERLRIPGGRYHLVRPGNTGIAIARAYGVEWSRIVTANDLVEPFILRAGQRILIPGGNVAAVTTGPFPEPTAPPPRSSAAERAAAFSLDIDDILTGGEPAIASNQTPAKPAPTAKRVLPVTAAVTAPLSSPGLFVWPVEGNIVKRFGAGASGEKSNGIKIAVPLATPIRAAAAGTVAYVGDGIAALGGLVIIRHGENWTSVYGHASKLLVQRGQSVKKGQTIALSGDTGFADRPEVHFELRKGRAPVDPVAQLPRR